MTGEQRKVLRQAVEDAVYYRDPPLKCSACETAADLCSACTEGLAIGLVYLRTARELRLDDG
jgi:hypothetical protein